MTVEAHGWRFLWTRRTLTSVLSVVTICASVTTMTTKETCGNGRTRDLDPGWMVLDRGCLESHQPVQGVDMSTFDTAVRFVLSMEGEPSNDPRDPGGYTKHGLSIRSHPETATLSKDAAIQVYKTNYWDSIAGDEIHPAWALLLFDMAVNQGVKPAIKLAQKAVGVAQDGIMGPVTIQALKGVAHPGQLALLMSDRVIRYVGTRGFDRYGRGWVKRCFEAYRVALQEIP